MVKKSLSISVRVILLANFREIVGKKEVVERVGSGSTLGHILDMLANRYGKDFKQIVDQKKGAISSEFLVSINGQVVRDPDVRLNSEDILVITIAVGGG